MRIKIEIKLSRDAQAKGSREDENWEGRGIMEGVHSMYNMHLYENLTKYKPILKEIQ